MLNLLRDKNESAYRRGEGTAPVTTACSDDGNEKRDKTKIKMIYKHTSDRPDAVIAVGTPLVRQRRLRPRMIPQVYRVSSSGKLGIGPVVVQRFETTRFAHPRCCGLLHLLRSRNSTRTVSDSVDYRNDPTIPTRNEKKKPITAKRRYS